MSKFRTGAILVVAVLGVVAAGTVVILNAQKKSAGVVAEPNVFVSDGRDQIRTMIVGDGPQIGVGIREVGNDEVSALKLPAAGGAVVESVSADRPAEKAGVKAGDVIVEFDGEKIRSAAQLTRLVRESAAGRAVKMAVWRDGKRVDLVVAPEEGSLSWTGEGEPGRLLEKLRVRPEAGELPRLGRQFRLEVLPERGNLRLLPREDLGGAFSLLTQPGQGRLGIGIEDLTDQLAAYFGAKSGVLVRSVDGNSPAAKAGVKAGDVITSINGKTVEDANTLMKEVRQVKDGTDVTLGVLRDKKTLTLTARLEAAGSPPRRPLRRGIVT